MGFPPFPATLTTLPFKPLWISLLNTASPNTPVSKIGIAAALVTVLLWTSWITGSRFAVSGDHPLDPALLALIRFGTAAIVLAPFWWKVGVFPRGRSPWVLAGLMLAGLPYQFLVLWGLSLAPASEAGPLLTGSLPFFVVALALIARESVGRARLIGVGLISIGVLAITASSLLDASSGSWRGHLLVLGAALSWSVYTVAFRHSGLTAPQAAACVSFWSVLLLLPFSATRVAAELPHIPLAVLGHQVLLQGLMAGVLSLVTYTTAVRHLGAGRATAITALTPATAIIAAGALLGEWPVPSQWLGAGLIVLGVLLASGVVGQRLMRARPAPGCAAPNAD